jgi:hypothetical protein
MPVAALLLGETVTVANRSVDRQQNPSRSLQQVYLYRNIHAYRQCIAGNESAR